MLFSKKTDEKMGEQVVNETPVSSDTSQEVTFDVARPENDEEERIEPTEEEMLTLRKVRDHFPLGAFLIAIVELAERFTYYGLTGPFQNYIQRPRDWVNDPAYNGGPGGIASKPYADNKQIATGLTTFFSFWCYVTPIPAGMLADMKLGKFKVICIACAFYVCGLLILQVTSLPQYMESAGLGGLVVAMILLGLGTGGIKSNVSTLIAEQYTNTKPYIRVLKSGERVIVDPGATLEFIYSMFYWTINIGALSAIATTELEHNVDFWAAFCLPFAFFSVAIITLIFGRNRYVIRPPQGSPIPHTCRIVWLTFKEGLKPKSTRYHPESVERTEEEKLLDDYTIPKSAIMQSLNNIVYPCFKWWKPVAARFNLDIAKPSIREQLGLEPVPWTDVFVEEVRRGVYGFKVFVFYPIFWVCYTQISGNLTSQAGQANTHELPNDILQNLDPITIIIFIPIFNMLIYPTLRKLGFRMLPITRIAFGFVVCACSMGYAAGFQKLIYETKPEDCGEGAYDFDGGFCTASKTAHVAIQTPAWALMGISEILASLTGNEFAFTHAPASIKSFVMSLFLLTNAFGSALNEALTPVLEDPKIMFMYTGLAVAALIAGIVFWFTYQDINDKEIAWEKLSDVVAEKEVEEGFGGEEYLRKRGVDAENLAPVMSTASKVSRASRALNHVSVDGLEPTTSVTLAFKR